MTASQTVKPLQLTESRLLIGEGIEEQRFFTALLKAHSVTAVQVLQYGGKHKLRKFLSSIHTLPGFGGVVWLGVTRDADDDFASATQSVDDAVVAARVLWPVSPRVETFILPNNRDSGMLETLCVQSVADERVVACVNEFVECVAKSAPGRPGNRDKAMSHAFLASLPTPDLRLAEAAEAGEWKLTHSAFQPFVDFVRGASGPAID